MRRLLLMCAIAAGVWALEKTVLQSGGSAVSRRAFLGAAMLGAVGAARPRLTRGPLIAMMGGGGETPDPFVGHNVMEIEVPSGGGTFYVTNFNSNGHSEPIDWGDGTTSSHFGGGYVYAFATHSYSGGGKYIVKISDNVIWFGASGDRSETAESRLWVKRVWGIFSAQRSQAQGKNFMGCANLESIKCRPLHTSVVCVGCTSLLEAYDLSLVEFIEGGTFYGCTGITEIGDMPHVKEISTDAFSSMPNLKKVGSLSSVENVGYYVFNNDNAIEQSGPWPVVPPSIARSIPSTGSLLIPSGSIEAYRQDANFGRYASRFVAV